MRHFTTVTDVVEELYRAEPEFVELLSEDQLADVVRATRRSRYEEIGDEEFTSILFAAYYASGASLEDAERMARA